MGKVRILVVDDHPIIGEALQVFLQRYPDIEVVGIARDGLEGLEHLQRYKPNVVIVDLGFAETQRHRGDPSLPAVRHFLDLPA